MPASNMTLYAHYTGKKIQTVQFSLGCDYGYRDTVSFMGEGNGYDCGNNHDIRGPLEPLWGDLYTDEDASKPRTYALKDRVWSHNYVLGNNKFTIDNLPEPHLDGYEFKGWYTVRKDVPQEYHSYDGVDFNSGVKVTSGQKLDSDVTVLYARFSKKLTISFDDLHGGVYPDITIDTYQSIKDAGYSLPVLDFPGTTFIGWSLNSDLDEGGLNCAVTNDTIFTNIVSIKQGFECTGDDAINFYTYHWRELMSHFGETGHGTCANWPFYEETNHITIYPIYECHEIELEFDPKGGTISNHQDVYFTFYNEDTGDYKKGFCYMKVSGGLVYGTHLIPGHENPIAWYDCHGYTALPRVFKTYYDFAGWYYLDDKGVEREFTLDTVIVDNMKIYAKWTPAMCRVKFSPTDGTISETERTAAGLDEDNSYKVPTETILLDSDFKIPIPVSKDGRKFLGWVDRYNKPLDETTKIVKDTTFFPEWGSASKSSPVTLKFDLNGGTISNSGFKEINTITRDTKFNKFYTPVRDGYDFSGWYVLKPGATDYNSDSSFISTKIGSSLSIDNSMIAGLDDGDDDNGTVTIVARWQEQAKAESIYVLDDTWESIPENKTYEVKYTGEGTSVPLGFGAVLLPETIKNKKLYWSVDDTSAIKITGADADGKYEITSSNWFDAMTFGKLTPVREGKTVILTAVSSSNDAVKFSIKIHITFDI